MTESLIDTLPSPIPGLEPGLIARLAADLGNAGWSVDAMETMISPTARAALMRNQRVPAIRELQRKDSAAAVLTRFFVLGCAESGDVLAQALPTLGVHGAVDLGLIFPALDAESPSGQQLFKANYDLRPHAAQLHGGLKNWWILSDLGEDVTGEPIRPDHVLGIGGATTSLLKATLRTPVESAFCYHPRLASKLRGFGIPRRRNEPRSSGAHGDTGKPEVPQARWCCATPCELGDSRMLGAP